MTLPTLSRPKSAFNKLVDFAFEQFGDVQLDGELTAKYNSEDGIVAFVRDVLRVSSIKPYQERNLRKFYRYRRLAVRAPHGAGKTAFASWCIMWVFTVYHEDVKIPCTASVWRQLTKFLFPEIKKWAAQADWEKVGMTMRLGQEILDLSIKLPGKEAFAVASNVASAIEGAHAKTLCYVLDEAKAIPDPIWDAVEGAFSNAGEGSEFIAFALAISTPGDNSGRFYDIHARKEGYEDWETDHFTLQECIAAGQITQDWVERRKKQWGEHSPVFQQRVLGNFAADTKEQVIPLSWVEAAIERWKEVMESGDAPVAIEGLMSYGLDPAWTGADKSAMAYLVGNIIMWVDYFTHVDPMPLVGEMVGAMRREYAKYLAAVKAHNHGLNKNDENYIEIVPLDEIPVGVDAIGIGAGVYSRLDELGYNAYAVKVSEKTDLTDLTGVETFVNLRSAVWWGVRDWLNPENGNNAMLPPDDKLIGDLTTPKWKYMSDGRIRVEPKDEIFTRLQRSTDGGDAVCAALYMRVRKRYARVSVA